MMIVIIHNSKARRNTIKKYIVSTYVKKKKKILYYICLVDYKVKKQCRHTVISFEKKKYKYFLNHDAYNRPVIHLVEYDDRSTRAAIYVLP